MISRMKASLWWLSRGRGFSVSEDHHEAVYNLGCHLTETRKNVLKARMDVEIGKRWLEAGKNLEGRKTKGSSVTHSIHSSPTITTQSSSPMANLPILLTLLSTRTHARADPDCKIQKGNTRPSTHRTNTTLSSRLKPKAAKRRQNDDEQRK
jgi:hypothetical protein